MNYNAIARLADPDALGRAAMDGGLVDVVVSVPIGAFAAAYGLLRPIMDDGAPHLEAWQIEEGRSEEELRLLCGLLCTVEDNLPMDTAHHLKRLEAIGPDQYLDEFAAKRIARMKGSADLRAALEAAVRGLAKLAGEDEARGEEATMYMDLIIDAIWSGTGGRLDWLEGAAWTLEEFIREEKDAKLRRHAV